MRAFLILLAWLLFVAGIMLLVAAPFNSASRIVLLVSSALCITAGLKAMRIFTLARGNGEGSAPEGEKKEENLGYKI
jgi:hypothetical protein